MGHTHTEPAQHDMTSSAYIFRIDGDEPRILLHHHVKLGGYMQFGGHVELDEHPWQAVSRELREEAGYDLDQLEVLQQPGRIEKIKDVVLLPQPAAVLNLAYGTINHFHDDLVYVFVTREEPRHAPSAGESKEMLLFSKSELSGPKGEIALEDVRHIAAAIFDTCLPSWKAVPAVPVANQKKRL